MLIGGVGDDILSGGAGLDVFYMDGGNDMIVDLLGQDEIVFSIQVVPDDGYDQADLIALAHDTARGLVFDLEGGQTLTLLGIHDAQSLVERVFFYDPHV